MKKSKTPTCLRAAHRQIKLLIERFKEHMQMKNFSHRTVRDYGHHLGYFIKYLKEDSIDNITDVTPEIIYKYQMSLYTYKKKDDSPLSLGTQASRLVPIKSFFRYLLKSGYVVYDPARDIELPRQKKQLPKNIMTKKEIFRVLSKPDPDTLLGLRDRAILEVLYSTGIRSAELRALTVYDIDYINGDLRVIEGKNAKDRVVPIGEIACRYVEQYIKEIRPQLLLDHSQKILFVSKNGKSITAANLISMIKKYIKLARIKKNITPHSFRHTCATHLLKGRASLRHIQEMLGHYSLETTQIYTKVEMSDLKRAHRQSHPREKR